MTIIITEESNTTIVVLDTITTIINYLSTSDLIKQNL